MANIAIRTERCKGCGLCITACPKGLLSLNQKEINEKGYHYAQIEKMDQCIGCAFCATMCPDCVITVER